MFCSESFTKGASDSVLDVAVVADIVIMDGVVPAVQASSRAIYATVCWAEKWVAPLLICAAQIAWVLWTDLIWWGICRGFAALQAWVDAQVEACEADEELEALQPEAEQASPALATTFPWYWLPALLYQATSIVLSISTIVTVGSVLLAAYVVKEAPNTVLRATGAIGVVSTLRLL